jgi:hypothetical protein
MLKKDNRIKVYCWVMIVVSVVLLIVSFNLFIQNIGNSRKIIDEKKYPYYIIVSNHFGIDVNSSSFRFGMISPGSSSNRYFKVQNNYGKSVFVEIYSDGDLSRFLKISNNNFLLEKNKSELISITVSIPAEFSYGNYSGNIIMLFKETNLES